MPRFLVLMAFGALAIFIATGAMAQSGKQWSYGNGPYYNNPSQYGYGKGPYYSRPPVSYYPAPLYGQPYILMSPRAFGFTVPPQANYPRQPVVVYPYGYYPYWYGY